MRLSIHSNSIADKTGKKWLYVSLTALTLGLGLAGPVVVNADTSAPDDANSATHDDPVQGQTPASDLQKSTVPLPKSAPNTPGDGQAPTEPETNSANKVSTLTPTNSGAPVTPPTPLKKTQPVTESLAAVTPTTNIAPEKIDGTRVFRAVLVDNPANLDTSTYQAAPDWLQQLMPKVTTDNTFVLNSKINLRIKTTSDTTFSDVGFSRSRMDTVNYVSTLLVKLADLGYNTVLYENYAYSGFDDWVANSLATDQITALDAATGGTNRTITAADGTTQAISDMYYIRFVKEMVAHDHTVHVGDTINITDYLEYLNPHTGETAATPGADYDLFSPDTIGGYVKTTVYDPDGLLTATSDPNVFQVARTPRVNPDTGRLIDQLPTVRFGIRNTTGSMNGLINRLITLNIEDAVVKPTNPTPSTGGQTTTPTDPNSIITPPVDPADPVVTVDPAKPLTATKPDKIKSTTPKRTTTPLKTTKGGLAATPVSQPATNNHPKAATPTPVNVARATTLPLTGEHLTPLTSLLGLILVATSALLGGLVWRPKHH